MLLVGKNIEEPADTTGDGQYCPQNQDGETGDESGKEQGDTESDNDRPGGGRWQSDRGSRRVAGTGLCVVRRHSDRFPLATNDVDDGEDDDPYDIHKMPIHGERVDVLCVLFLNLAEESQEQNREESDETNRHVKSV